MRTTGDPNKGKHGNEFRDRRLPNEGTGLDPAKRRAMSSERGKKLVWRRVRREKGALATTDEGRVALARICLIYRAAFVEKT